MLELLSPAGNLEKAKAAVRFGADAIYMAGPGFGMRAANAGMPLSQLAEAINHAHDHGVRAYVTVNTMPREYESAALEQYLLDLARLSPDALIVADIGVIATAKKLIPHIPLHLSTQANATNAAACRAWHELGVSRIVLARELSLEEIAAIRHNIPDELELEAFAHGSMCISYSGRCLLSSHLTDRDANRGLCTQSCRWNYQMSALEGVLYEEKRPDTPIYVQEEQGETFFMSSKDMCMISHIAEMAQAGITSLKIEGRAKSAYYTAVVTNAYRMAIDAWKQGITDIDPAWQRELESVSHREYATGFYFPDERDAARITKKSGYMREKAYLADVLSYNADSGEMLCIQRNKLISGMQLELLTPGRTGIRLTAEALCNENGECIDTAPHPMMKFYMKAPFPVKPGDILRDGREESMVGKDCLL